MLKLGSPPGREEYKRKQQTREATLKRMVFQDMDQYQVLRIQEANLL